MNFSIAKRFVVASAAALSISTLTSVQATEPSKSAYTVNPRPDLLLSVDSNRAQLISRAIERMRADFSSDELKIMERSMNKLRADELLPVLLGYSGQNMLEALANTEHAQKALAAQSGGVRSKALGDPQSDLTYTPITPCRIVDTRQATLGRLTGQTFRSFDVIATTFADQGGSATNCNIDVNASAVAINVVAVDAQGTGHLRTWPSDLPLTGTSSLNYAPSSTQFAEANFIISPICLTNCPDNKEISIYTVSNAHIVVDVYGYFKPPSGNGLRVIPTTGAYPDAPNVINGSASNQASGAGVQGATVAGGGYTGNGCTAPGGTNGYHCDNRALGTFSIVGGGFANEATAFASAVFGGQSNIASAANSAVLAGQFNQATQQNAVIVGGQNNIASGARSIAVGGDQNTASGDGSVVSGGRGNTAAGINSWAGGTRANAATGSFVWSDNALFSQFSSVGNNSFDVRATGGVRFATSINGVGGVTTECSIPAGGAATWSCTSDRNAKENIIPVNARDVLSRVVSMPLSTWQYKGVTRRHLSPMAQDFWSAFGLGVNDTSITATDVGGVALAAIQGVHEKVTDEVKSLRAQNEALKKELAMIKRKLGLK